MNLYCPYCKKILKVNDTSNLLDSNVVYLTAHCEEGHVIEAAGISGKHALEDLRSHVQTSIEIEPTMGHNRRGQKTAVRYNVAV